MSEVRAAITEVSIPSNPDYLSRLRRIIGCLADCAGMDSKEIHDAKLAVTEACANAIRHGSPNGGENKVDIRISSSTGVVITEITDQGKGFDLSEILARETPETGGMGIPLMMKLSDEIEFLKDGKGMTVRMVKKSKSSKTHRWNKIHR